MKRSRGRGRKPHNGASRSIDSNGPDVKIRGNASHIYDKYQALARDAHSVGDRIGAENFQQHAEHYYRVMKAAQQQNAQTAPSESSGGTGADRQRQGANGSGADSTQPSGDAEVAALREAEVAAPREAQETALPKPIRRRRPRKEEAAAEGESAEQS